MDILYTIGEHSGHDNMELRWSLRSITKYGKNLGRIIVTGYPPFWLSDEVIKRPFGKKVFEKHKCRHIFDQVCTAIKEGLVQDYFLLSSDDHFLSKEMDLNSIGFMKKDDFIKDYDKDNEGGDEICRKAYQVTRDVLIENGYSAMFCNFHRNTLLNANDLNEALRLAEYGKNNSELNEYGYESTILFQNIHAKKNNIVFEKTKDYKINCFNEEAIENGAFSISDNVFFDNKFIDYMNSEFGNPCKFERCY